MAPGRDPPSDSPEMVDTHIRINETDARGAMRVGLIRQLVVSIVCAVAVIWAVWVMTAPHG